MNLWILGLIVALISEIAANGHRHYPLGVRNRHFKGSISIRSIKNQPKLKIQTASSRSSRGIPLSLVRQMNDMSPYEQQQFVNGKKFEKVSNSLDYERLPNQISKGSMFRKSLRSGSTFRKTESKYRGLENKEAPFLLEQGSCKLVLQTVELPIPNDTDSVYYPMAVRIEQCNGCCNTNLLMCQPLETEEVDVSVTISQYNPETNSLKPVNETKYSITRHKRCSCDCRIQRSHCNPDIQEHDEANCRCQCKNKEEMATCSNSLDKVWNEDTCKCECDPYLGCWA